MRTIDPADIPAGAKGNVRKIAASTAGVGSSQLKRNPSQDRLSQISQATAVPSQGKRKATQAELDRFSQIRQALVGLPSSSPALEEPEEAPEEEVKDEIYCNLNTNVVGIQYYKGMFGTSIKCDFLNALSGLVGPGEEVLLVREPHNPYDRYLRVFHAQFKSLYSFIAIQFKSRIFRVFKSDICQGM